MNVICTCTRRKTFAKICKKGSVEQFSAMPYLATMFNCGMWILYGLPVFHPKSILVLTINGSGFVIELVFLVLYLVYSDTTKQRVKIGCIMGGELGFVGVVGLLVGTLVKSVKQRTTIIGSVCMLGCFLMYAAPLSVMVSLPSCRPYYFDFNIYYLYSLLFA